MSDNNLNGKIVVVTGAAGQLGQRLVRRFAEAGAVIAAIIRDEQQALQIPFPEDAEGWAFPTDVTDEKMVQACFEQIADQLGRVDVLVHAVGHWEARPLLQTTIEDWDGMVKVNLTSTFLCFREAVRLMPSGGRLIAFSAVSGMKGAGAEGAYSAAKAGVSRLVEATADEFGAHNVQAWAVAPTTLSYEEGEAGVSADEVVELCLYLASGAGHAMSGQTINVERV